MGRGIPSTFFIPLDAFSISILGALGASSLAPHFSDQSYARGWASGLPPAKSGPANPCHHLAVTYCVRAAAVNCSLPSQLIGLLVTAVNMHAPPLLIVLSHWPHVAEQVRQHVASVKGLGHKLPNLLLNLCPV